MVACGEAVEGCVVWDTDGYERHAAVAEGAGGQDGQVDATLDACRLPEYPGEVDEFLVLEDAVRLGREVVRGLVAAGDADVAVDEGRRVGSCVGERHGLH